MFNGKWEIEHQRSEAEFVLVTLQLQARNGEKSHQNIPPVLFMEILAPDLLQVHCLKISLYSLKTCSRVDFWYFSGQPVLTKLTCNEI